MNRRTLFAGTGIALSTSIGGCFDGSPVGGDGDGDGYGDGSGDPSTPTELVETTFTTGIDGAPAADEPPTIAFDEGVPTTVEAVEDSEFNEFVVTAP